MHNSVLSVITGFLIAISTASTSIYAQISNTDVQKLGLETAWRAQLQVPRRGAGIIAVKFWVSDESPREFASVELGNRTVRVSASELDSDGKSLGLENAKAAALKRASKLAGSANNLEIIETKIPRIYMVVATSDGLIQTLDAESGEVLWRSACGEPNLICHAADVCAAGVTVVQGDNYYVLDWRNGKIVSVQKMRHWNSNAMVNCPPIDFEQGAKPVTISFITDFRGYVTSMGVENPIRYWSFLMQGNITGEPVALSKQAICAIATDANKVFFFRGGNRPLIANRFDSSTPIVEGLATGNDAIYVATTGGVIAKIAFGDAHVEPVWEMRSGRTLVTKPLIVGEQVFVATEAGSLIAINDLDGQLQWMEKEQEIVQPLAVVGNSLYCSTNYGEIAAFDIDSGNPIFRSSPIEIGLPIVNKVDDRLYLLSATGQLTCLRAEGNEFPTLIEPVELKSPTEENMVPASNYGNTPTEPAPEMLDNTFNPFGTGSSSENQPATGTAPTEDPFSLSPF